MVFLELAAMANDDVAQVTLAIVLKKTNAAKSKYWLQVASQRGNAQAQYMLGLLEMRTNGSEGIRLVHLAAKKRGYVGKAVLGEGNASVVYLDK